MAPRFTREDPEVRRRALIAATERCLARDGRAGASVRRVAAEAGVSAGLIRHHFGGMDRLIAETYRAIGLRVMAEILRRQDAAGPAPEDRLRAMIEANFGPPILDPDLMATWLSLWALVRQEPLIRAVHAEVYADYRARLEALLAAAAARRGAAVDPRLAALGLSAMLDGLWLELCLDPTAFTAEEAIGLALSWVDSVLAGRAPPV